MELSELTKKNIAAFKEKKREEKERAKERAKAKVKEKIALARKNALARKKRPKTAAMKKKQGQKNYLLHKEAIDGARHRYQDSRKLDPNKQYSREELEQRMTPAQVAFCRSYVIDLNNRKALEAAGYKVSNASAQGWRIKKLPVVQLYLESLQKDLEKTCGISKAKNIQELANMAYSNIADLHKDWFTLEDFDKLTREQKASIKSITKTTTSRGTVVKIELHDKKAALDTINKMMGYTAPQKVEVTSEISYGDNVLSDLRRVLGLSPTEEPVINIDIEATS